MKTYQKILAATVLATPGVLALASQANAQVAGTGIAIADPEVAILSAKALETANQLIGTTYKVQLDQAVARREALQKEITALAGPLDTNKDKQVDDKEMAAAEAAKNPNVAKLRAAQEAGEADIARLNTPASRAQAFAIEQIILQYNPAMRKVVEAKKISLLMTSGSVQFAQPTVNVSADITKEIDKILPSVNITPPANWQPQQQTIALQRQYQQVLYVEALQRAQAAQQGGAAAPAAGGAAPAATPPKPQPQGR